MCMLSGFFSLFSLCFCFCVCVSFLFYGSLWSDSNNKEEEKSLKTFCVRPLMWRTTIRRRFRLRLSNSYTYIHPALQRWAVIGNIRQITRDNVSSDDKAQPAMRTSEATLKTAVSIQNSAPTSHWCRIALHGNGQVVQQHFYSILCQWLSCSARRTAGNCVHWSDSPRRSLHAHFAVLNHPPRSSGR